MLSKPKNRKIAALLAFAGVLLPGLHKFYLGQPRWGVVYLVLGWSTPISISRIASVLEGLWYLFQDQDGFECRFNSSPGDPQVYTSLIEPSASIHFADAIRQLDQLRQEGLLSEYEFEQKRRQFIDRMG